MVYIYLLVVQHHQQLFNLQYFYLA